MEIEALRELAMRNFDPKRFPVSAALTEGIRRIVMNPATDSSDAGALLAELASAVIELERRVLDADKTLDYFERITAEMSAMNATNGKMREAIEKLAGVTRQIVDRIDPP